jgi:hypothetical protein
MESILTVIGIVLGVIIVGIAIKSLLSLVEDWLNKKMLEKDLKELRESRDKTESTCGICSRKYEYLSDHLIIKNVALGTVYGMKFYDHGICKVGRVCKHCIKNDPKLKKIAEFNYFYDDNK